MDTKQTSFVDDWNQQICPCEDGGILYNTAHGTTDIDADGCNGVVRLELAQTVHTPPWSLPGRNETFFLGLDEAEELVKELTAAIREAGKIP